MAKASEWKARVAEWRGQGVSAAKYCERRGISPKQLQTWAWKLGLSARSSATKATAETPLRLLRVVSRKDATGPAAKDAERSGVRLAVAGITVDVQSNFDRVVLRDVLSILGSHAGGQR